MRAASAASASGEASDRLSASFDLCRQTFALSLATKKEEEVGEKERPTYQLELYLKK